MDMVICQCTALSFQTRNYNLVPLILGLPRAYPPIQRGNPLDVTLSARALNASSNAYCLLHSITAGCHYHCPVSAFFFSTVTPYRRKWEASHSGV